MWGSVVSRSSESVGGEIDLCSGLSSRRLGRRGSGRGWDGGELQRTKAAARRGWRSCWCSCGHGCDLREKREMRKREGEGRKERRGRSCCSPMKSGNRWRQGRGRRRIGSSLESSSPSDARGFWGGVQMGLGRLCGRRGSIGRCPAVGSGSDDPDLAATGGRWLAVGG